MKRLLLAALTVLCAAAVPRGAEAKSAPSGVLPAGLCGFERYLRDDACGKSPPAKYALLLGSPKSTREAEALLQLGRAAGLAAGYPFAVSTYDLPAKVAVPGDVAVVAALFADRKRADAYAKSANVKTVLVELDTPEAAERRRDASTDAAMVRHGVAVELTRDTPAWAPTELEVLEKRLDQMKWIPYDKQLVRRDKALARIRALCSIEGGSFFMTNERALDRFHRVFAPARCPDGREAWVPWRSTRLESVVRTTAAGPRIFQVVLVECDNATVEQRRWEPPKPKLVHRDMGGPLLSWSTLPRFAAATLLVALPACSGSDGGPHGATSSGGGSSTGHGGVGGATSSSGASTTAAAGGGGGGAPEGVPYAYVGSGDGTIRVYTLDRATGALALVQESVVGADPSFLAFAPDRRHLYASDEGTNELSAFALDAATGAIAALNSVPSNGTDPAHVAIDATGSFVFGVNYGSGSVTVVPMLADGSLGAPLETLPTGANAREIALDPSNRFAFVPNKGDNDVSQLLFDDSSGALTANSPPTVAFPAGSGPRRLAFHPSAPFAYVIDEFDDTLVALDFDASGGALTPFQSLSTLPTGFDPDANTCAEVAFATPRFLYGSNRGHDSLVIVDVDETTGAMSLVGFQPTSGTTPRHFSVEPSGEILLVANQGSNTVVTFRVDAASGLLTELEATSVPGGPAFVGVVYLAP